MARLTTAPQIVRLRATFALQQAPELAAMLQAIFSTGAAPRTPTPAMPASPRPASPSPAAH